MDSDLATSLVTARAAGTQQAVAIAIQKQAHDADTQVVQMLDQAVRSAPAPAPEGQGLKVDKLA